MRTCRRVRSLQLTGDAQTVLNLPAKRNEIQKETETKELGVRGKTRAGEEIKSTLAVGRRLEKKWIFACEVEVRN